MIEGYIGIPGSGKTLSMTTRAYKERRWYDEIWANYTLNFPQKKIGKFDGQVGRFQNAEQFFQLCNGWLHAQDGKRRLILLDEVHLIFDARNWNKVPKEMLQFLAQPRKAKTDLLFTAQHESQVEKRLKVVVNWLWLCRMWGSEMNWFGDHPLVFWATCYESFEFRSPRARNYGARCYRFRPKYGQLYNTLEVLQRMDLDDVGTHLTQSVQS